MKKVFFVIIVICMSISAGITYAQADVLDSYDFYLAHANGTADKQFDLNEMVYLHTVFDDGPFDNTKNFHEKVTLLNLQFPAHVYNITKGDELDSYFNSTTGFWDIKLELTPDFTATAGTWDLYADWKNISENHAGNNTLTYSVVTPEPISTVLFTVGGLAFIARRKFMGK